jgi:peptide/nickel transport system permease protein
MGGWIHECEARRILKRVGPAAIVGLLALVLAASPGWIAGYDPSAQDVANRLRPPLTGDGHGLHFLGTDSLGRDLWSRIVYGFRVSATIALVSVGTSGTVGTVVGMLAGLEGGVIDSLVMRLTDVQLAIPSLVLAVAIVAALGGGAKSVILALVLSGWVPFARTVRAEVLELHTREFVLAARAVGCTTGRILQQHLLPNIAPTAVTLAALEAGRAVLTEASLSYLGLGIQPPMSSWGAMVAEGQPYLFVAWWVAVLPGLAILALALTSAFLGDWLRDRMDPRLWRGGRSGEGNR